MRLSPTERMYLYGSPRPLAPRVTRRGFTEAMAWLAGALSGAQIKALEDINRLPSRVLAQAFK